MSRIPDVLWPIMIMATVVFASGRSEIASPDVGISLDKAAHFAVFGALATSMVRLAWFGRRGWRGTLAAAGLAMLFGATDEWRQSWTPGRSVELADWIADALGALAAVVVYQGWAGYRRLLERKIP